MLNYTAYSEQSITTEVDRYLTWPGQACGYKIGELKIKELRAKAQKDLGNLYMHLFISSILAISVSMERLFCIKKPHVMFIDRNFKGDVRLVRHCIVTEKSFFYPCPPKINEHNHKKQQQTNIWAKIRCI